MAGAGRLNNIAEIAYERISGHCWIRLIFIAFFHLAFMTAAAVMLCGCGAQESSAVIEGLTVNYRTNPIGTETTPVFGWRMEDDTAGQKQTACRIVVADSETGLANGDYIWDSGEMQSGLSAAVPYEGEALMPATRYYWKVYVKDKDGINIVSDETAYFETGLPDDGWEDTQWIYCDTETSSKNSMEQDAEYTISYDFKMDSSYAGIMWGGASAEGGCGEYNLWAFDALSDEVEFAIMRMDNETILEESRQPLSVLGWVADKDWFVNTVHTMKIDVKGTHAAAYLDGTIIAQKELEDTGQLGMLGFWVTRGAYEAYYDNVHVTDANGHVIYEETFDSSDDHIFSPYYIKIVDGWLKASSGVITTPGGEEPAPMFRRKFSLAQQNGKIARARLHVTALGTYEVYLNGQEVSAEYFAPGVSYYAQEVYYRTYDVTDYLNTSGDNVLCAVLGHGRYDRAKSEWGDNLALRGKLVICYEDGSEEVIASDDTWKTYDDGPVRRDDLFWGEYYDANYEEEGWLTPEYDDIGWENAARLDDPNVTAADIKAYEGEPVMCVEEISPAAVTNPEEGCFVYDFGQNFNGICRIVVEGDQGRVITLRYAEALNEEDMICRDDDVGKVWTQNLYTARNTDYYVMKGSDREVFEPEFVCRGFRYVQITGLDSALAKDDIRALVLTTQNKRTGYFECSDEKINTLYNSIYWTQLSNYVDIPTDCPQRDERLAWSGDAQVFAASAAYNADIYTFMDRYLDILRAGQLGDGSIQDIGAADTSSGGNNGWGDAIVTIPWTLYIQYGNDRIITENMDAMCRYVDYLVNTSEDYIRYDEGFGDHNGISVPEEELSNTAQCAHAADLLARMCRAVGNDEGYEKYHQIFLNYKQAWQSKYINEDGSVGNWLPAEYVLGLAYDLYPDELTASGADKLNMVVELQDYHVTTGYVSTPYLLPILCKYGYVDSAYRLVEQDSYPSWNYMFAHGATTITESWGTYYETDDSRYGINGSLNHCALGSAASWFYTDILGIKADENEPGFHHFFIQPKVGGGITSASGSYESMYGVIESSWQIDRDGQIVYRCTIPPNTSATVYLPGDDASMELPAGTYEFRRAYVPASPSVSAAGQNPAS